MLRPISWDPEFHEREHATVQRDLGINPDTIRFAFCTCDPARILDSVQGLKSSDGVAFQINGVCIGLKMFRQIWESLEEGVHGMTIDSREKGLMVRYANPQGQEGMMHIAGNGADQAVGHAVGGLRYDLRRRVVPKVEYVITL